MMMSQIVFDASQVHVPSNDYLMMHLYTHTDNEHIILRVRPKINNHNQNMNAYYPPPWAKDTFNILAIAGKDDSNTPPKFFNWQNYPFIL